eukprot:5839899-Pyramimonas_sp.AAC.1
MEYDPTTKSVRLLLRRALVTSSATHASTTRCGGKAAARRAHCRRPQKWTSVGGVYRAQGLATGQLGGPASDPKTLKPRPYEVLLGCCPLPQTTPILPPEAETLKP